MKPFQAGIRSESADQFAIIPLSSTTIEALAGRAAILRLFPFHRRGAVMRPRQSPPREQDGAPVSSTDACGRIFFPAGIRRQESV